MTIIPSVEFRMHEDLPWVVYANGEDPDILGRFASGEDVRSFLYDHSRFDADDRVLLRDADGNGADAAIPLEWLGDGEPLVMSRRVLEIGR